MKKQYNEILSNPVVPNANGLYGISFFSGVRGFDIGAKKAGFSSLFLSDIMKQAGTAFKLNTLNPHEHLRSDGVYAVGKEAGDISKLSFGTIAEHIKDKLGMELKRGEAAVIHGGPPCQGFSKCNMHRVELSDRNMLIFELLRIINEAKPKLGLIEQVPDLLTPKFFRVWSTIKYVLNSMTDYIWDFQVMDASLYGARQKRRRLIIMMVRRDLDVPVSFPTPSPVDLSKVSVKSLLPHVNYFSPGQFKDSIKDTSKHIFCTMTATGSEKVYCHDGKGRDLTIEERLVLTELEGLNLEGISKGFQKKLLGNMVQVSFAEKLFKHIKENILQVSGEVAIGKAA